MRRALPARRHDARAPKAAAAVAPRRACGPEPAKGDGEALCAAEAINAARISTMQCNHISLHSCAVEQRREGVVRPTQRGAAQRRLPLRAEHAQLARRAARRRRGWEVSDQLDSNRRGAEDASRCDKRGCLGSNVTEDLDELEEPAHIGRGAAPRISEVLCEGEDVGRGLAVLPNLHDVGLASTIGRQRVDAVTERPTQRLEDAQKPAHGHEGERRSARCAAHGTGTARSLEHCQRARRCAADVAHDGLHARHDVVELAVRGHCKIVAAMRELCRLVEEDLRRAAKAQVCEAVRVAAATAHTVTATRLGLGVVLAELVLLVRSGGDAVVRSVVCSMSKKCLWSEVVEPIEANLSVEVILRRRDVNGLALKQTSVRREQDLPNDVTQQKREERIAWCRNEEVVLLLLLLLLGSMTLGKTAALPTPSAPMVSASETVPTPERRPSAPWSHTQP